MSQKITSLVVFIIILGVIFCVVFFKVRPFTPKPVKIIDSKLYFDVYDKPIMYKISIVGELQYSKWFNPWKRDDFEDSLKVASQRIMDDYFKTNYMNRVSDDSIINNFDSEKYFSSNIPFDSLNFEITVEKKISLKGKPPR